MMTLSKMRIRSPWIMHFDTGSCNGCDMEVWALLTPRYDIERFGAMNRANSKQADIPYNGAGDQEVRGPPEEPIRADAGAQAGHSLRGLRPTGAPFPATLATSTVVRTR